MSTARMRNVVLFGECGVGKSSVINAVAGKLLAHTSNNVLGCTDETASHCITLNSAVELKLWDTIGLNEGTAGKIPAGEAKEHLKQFLEKQIATPDGVDLLLYCFRGASGMRPMPVKRSHWDDYRFVFEHVCKKSIPVALIVTNLEAYNPGGDMDAWWEYNEQRLSELGFQFCAHACVSVLPTELCGSHDDMGRINVSTRKLRDLLSRDFLAPRNVLLIGVHEDRDDFLDATVSARKNDQSNHKVKGGFPGPEPFTCIPIAFDMHTHVNLWNTSRLGETDDEGFVTDKNLKFLVQGMIQTSGIDLLLFCFRAGRPKFRHAQNYHLFYGALCRKKIPVAIVVLGPKDATNLWWQRNEDDLKQKGFHFDRHIYIPCDPYQHPIGPLDDVARRQLIDLFQEEHPSGSWTICGDASWMTVPNVRAVVGELSWPSTTVMVCDTTREGAFARIASGMQSTLQRVAGPRRSHRFQRVDPGSISSIAGSRALDHGTKGISLLVFFVSANELDSKMWNLLARFYAVYNGSITPCIVVIHGVSERRVAEDFWKIAPRHIKRRIGAYLTYHPGLAAHHDVETAAQEVMVDMIQNLCLVDLGEKVGVLREILSVWRKYRSQHHMVSNGTVR